MSRQLPTRWPEDKSEAGLFESVQRLLETLHDPEAMAEQPLAQQLAPLFGGLYADLREADFPKTIRQGLTRLWQNIAGTEPPALVHRKRMERYFALMIWYLYPAQHGRHRFLISSDVRVGPIQSFTDPAARMGEPEYLALIYANGDLARARQALAQYGEVFTALSETRDDGQAVHPHPNTVNSRRKAAIRLLATGIAELLGPASGVGATHSLDIKSFPAEAPRPAGQTALQSDCALAEAFIQAVQQRQPSGTLSRMTADILQAAASPARAEQARGLAQQLAAISLGLEPAAERTRMLTPLNVRVALRRALPDLTDTHTGPACFDSLIAAGILTSQGGACRFATTALVEWFGAEFIATCAGHRYPPQARYRQVRRWAAGILAEQGDDERIAILINDLREASAGLHPVSLIDIAELMSVFDDCATPGVAGFLKWLTPELRRLEHIPSDRLHQSLRLLNVDGMVEREADDNAVESTVPCDVLESARATLAPNDLLSALSLPEELARQDDWYDTRLALEALIAQVQSPRDLTLACACAAWLQSASLTQTLEINLGWSWPPVNRVTALEALLQVSRQPGMPPSSRCLALSALADDAHLEQLLNLDTPEALATTMTLLLLTDRRAAWDYQADRWRLIAEPQFQTDPAPRPSNESPADRAEFGVSRNSPEHFR